MYNNNKQTRKIMNIKALELLETKIWLISFELENEDCTTDRIIELRKQNTRLIHLRNRMREVYNNN